MNLLKSSTTPSKCALKGCNNQAKNHFEGKKQKIFICDDCLKKLFDYALSTRIPKSPTNKVKQVMNKKQEELNG